MALREADYLVNTGWIRWSCYTWANDDDQQHCVRLRSGNRELCPLGQSSLPQWAENPYPSCRIMPAGRVTRRKDKPDQPGFFILCVYYSYKIYFDHFFIRCETKTFSVNYFSQHLTSGLCKNQGLTHLFNLLLYKLIEQKKTTMAYSL